jgi:hypothetical protein
MEKMRHHDFVCGLPPGWFDVSTVVLVGPAEGDFSPNIAITREPLPAPVSAEQYAADQLAQLKESLGEQDYRVLQEGMVTVGEQPAFQRLHIFRMPDVGVQVKQWQVYVIGRRGAVTLTCSDKVETFDRSFRTFQEAVNQFRFDPA